jgi:hypothetical protein
VSATFLLELDTRAPALTWGPVAGTTAGELLQVLYELDEPAIASARLELADGRHLAMAVAADRLTVVLPVDTPAGPATVRAFLADELGNTAQATRVLVLIGTVVVVEPTAPPAPGVSRPVPPTRRSPARTIATTTRIRLRSSSRVGTPPSSATRTRVALSSRTAVAPSPISGRTAVRLSARTGVAGRTSLPTAAAVHLRATSSVSFRDGRAIEEALLGLDPLNLL